MTGNRAIKVISAVVASFQLVTTEQARAA